MKKEKSLHLIIFGLSLIFIGCGEPKLKKYTYNSEQGSKEGYEFALKKIDEEYKTSGKYSLIDLSEIKNIKTLKERDYNFLLNSQKESKKEIENGRYEYADIMIINYNDHYSILSVECNLRRKFCDISNN